MSEAVPTGPVGDLPSHRANWTTVTVEVASAKEGQPHGDLRAVREEHLVTQIRALGRVAHTFCHGKTVTESFHPIWARRSYRHRHEVVDGERKDQMQLGTRRKQRFGPEDVPTCGQRAIGKADGPSGDRLGDSFLRRRFVESTQTG